ncbi:MAG: hypothetical protein M0R06_01630 [Sphaerochaeta sp.]|jgi:hypothetical protein|nr:hypothetical protein [Sphaerochaeta sp.]
MFEVDLSAQTEGEWFQFQDSHFDQVKGEWIFDPPATDARVRVRRTDTFWRERSAKRERVAEHVYNPKTRSMERISYLKEQTISEQQADVDDAMDYSITGLENFKDKNSGKVLECTRDVKLALMRVPAFDRFIGRCIRLLEGVEAKQKEESEKN